MSLRRIKHHDNRTSITNNIGSNAQKVQIDDNGINYIAWNFM